MPARKTISVDVLRQLLGESRTDEVLEKMRPSKPSIPVDVENLSLAKTLYADPLTESKQWEDTVPVIRRYFLERGQSRRAFLAWLDQSPLGGADGEPTPVRRRRPITDPEVLERRRAAMAKARAARKQRLEAAGTS